MKAEITDVDDKFVHFVTVDGNRSKVGIDDRIYLCNAEIWDAADGLAGVEDLTALTHLHEPEVLQALTDVRWTSVGRPRSAIKQLRFFQLRDMMYLDSLKDSSSAQNFMSNLVDRLVDKLVDRLLELQPLTRIHL